jgi:hypothetical protein
MLSYSLAQFSEKFRDKRDDFYKYISVPVKLSIRDDDTNFLECDSFFQIATFAPPWKSMYECKDLAIISDFENITSLTRGNIFQPGAFCFPYFSSHWFSCISELRDVSLKRISKSMSLHANGALYNESIVRRERNVRGMGYF